MMTGTSGRKALALGKSSRPLVSGMLMSERTRMSCTPVASVMRRSAAEADWANFMVNRPARRSRRKRWRNNTSTSGSSSTTRMSRLILVLLSVRESWRTRQNNSHFGELGSRIDLYRSRMLLHDDVVSDGQAKASAFPGRLRREEGIEHLLPDFGRNAGAVVANRDLYAVAEILRRSGKSRLIAIAIVLLFALRRRIEAVGDEVQKCPC